MRPRTLELRLFSTPWHWFVHGLGLGQNRTGFDPGRAARIRELGQAMVQRHGGSFQVFVAELVEIILRACDPSEGGGRGGDASARLGQLVAVMSDAREHALACALALDSLVQVGCPPRRGDRLGRELARSLDRVAALPAPDDPARYANVHLLAHLLLAAAQAGWVDLLRPRYLDAGAQLLGSIGDFFYHARGAATWEAILAMLAVAGGPEREDAGESLRHLLDRLDAQLERPIDRPCDGVHEGRDYVAFPLFLTLGALGPARRLDLLGYKRPWLEVAAAELSALSPCARASQTLFFVALLRSLGALARLVPDAPALVRATAAGYLAATDGCRLDDYLRCTYLVHLARQLGCPAVLPERIGQILTDSPAQLDTPGLFRATRYGSPLMLVAYVLSALHADGRMGAEHPCAAKLPALVRAGCARSDDAVTLPRLGLALIDAALCLGPPEGDRADQLGRPRDDRRVAG